jgi:hypothetical protein
LSTVPQIMVSSTFFDLKQLRADLARFIGEEMGCRALMSEWPSFPIDPDVDTLENCRRRVERDADILVLVIGGRYGSVDSQSAKSVTNLEYLAARAKGIPVYAFVERRILSILPVWRANKDGDFSGVVDDVRVFSFIEEVRDNHRVWTSEFDLALEIVLALRSQLAHLLLEGAQLVKRARSDSEYAVLRQLQGAPLRIALEKPPAWEYKLFAETLILELRPLQTASEQRRLGIVYGAYEYLDIKDLSSWSIPRMAELQGLIHGLDVLINEELRRALGPPGEPGSVELLVFCARSLASIYREAVEWVFRLRRTVGKEYIVRVTAPMDRFVDDILEKIANLGPLILFELAELLSSGPGESKVRTVKLDLVIPGIDEASEAFERLTQDLKALAESI